MGSCCASCSWRVHSCSGLVSLSAQSVAVPAMLEKLKVLLYVGHKAPVPSTEMHFVVRIEKAFSLKVVKDGVEEIRCSHVNVSPEPFYSDGKKYFV